MSKNPVYAATGTESEKIDVRLSYGIVRLFSEGLYASSNKAIEELVANAFDAGALHVAVLLAPDFHDQGATIAVIDDGEGMDGDGLKQHWLIGKSDKRAPSISAAAKQKRIERGARRPHAARSASRFREKCSVAFNECG